MRHGTIHLEEAVMTVANQFNKTLMEDTPSQVFHIRMVEVMMSGLLKQIRMETFPKNFLL